MRSELLSRVVALDLLKEVLQVSMRVALQCEKKGNDCDLARANAEQDDGRGDD